MASEDGDVIVNSSSYLFNLDDDDGYEDLFGTQFPNGNPDLPLLDLDEDFPSEATEHPTQQAQQTILQTQQSVQPPRQTVEAGATETSRQRTRAKIPEHVEIIDLDQIDADGSRGVLNPATPTPIKTEGQDVISLENDKTAAIKTEESETPFSWMAMPEKFINLADTDDEPNNNIFNNTQKAVIKQEHEEEWTWAAMQREVIELSDSSDDDKFIKLPPIINVTVSSKQAESPKQAEPSTQDEQLQQVEQNQQIEQPEQSEQFARSQATTASALTEPVSQVPNVKAKRTSADRAKLLQLQKMYAERALGKKVIVGAGSIFKGAQVPTGSAPVETENDLAWMNDTVDPNDDAEAATQFALLKAKYNRKKRACRNTFEDDVLFMKADSAEKARLKRLDDDYVRDRGPVYRYF